MSILWHKNRRSIKDRDKNLERNKKSSRVFGIFCRITGIKKRKKVNFLLAKHPKDSNFIIIEVQPNIFHFQANFVTEKTKSPEMDTVINEINSRFDVARVYFDVEEGKVVLHIESIYTGNYSKDIFGRFFSLLNNDIGRLFLLDNSKKAFLS